MPGIITHNKLLKETILYLQKKKKKNYLLRSIQSLFSEKDRLTSALFGSIGPNIYDYIPKWSRGNFFGSNISFSMHNGYSRKIIESLYNIIFSQKDKNTEWSSLQRAYLYGFISHIISDSIFHPFIFYFSGFTNSNSKTVNGFFREQFLLYQYAVDLYFLLFRTDAKSFKFSIQEMLPIKKQSRLKWLYPPIKSIILESLFNDFKDAYKVISLKKPKEGNSYQKLIQSNSQIGYLDAIPYLLSWIYRLKMTKNDRVRDLINKARKKNFTLSDITVLYPQIKTFDLHIVNHYRERWQYPTGSTSIHYESMENLFQISCEKIVDAWERVESSIYENKMAVFSDIIVSNAYTGVNDQNFSQMKQQNPIKIRY